MKEEREADATKTATERVHSFREETMFEAKLNGQMSQDEVLVLVVEQLQLALKTGKEVTVVISTEREEVVHQSPVPIAQA